MIIVTLVATLAASMVWQQWRAVQVESAERARAQSAWILVRRARLGPPDPEGGRRATAAPTTSASPGPCRWPKRACPPSSPPTSNATDDAPEAFLSGAITDAQARFNLTNLLARTARSTQLELAALERLCEATGIASRRRRPDRSGLLAA